MSTELVDKGKNMLESMRLNIFNTTASMVSSANRVVDILRKSATESGVEPKKDFVPEAPSKQASSIEIPPKPIELLNPRARIDYAIQGGVLENPYLSALGVQCVFRYFYRHHSYIILFLVSTTGATKMSQSLSSRNCTASTHPKISESPHNQQARKSKFLKHIY